jgi:hypothetical protein
MISNGIDFKKIEMDKKDIQTKKYLKLDKHLPQIIVPEKTLKMFMEWWNTDIRFEKSVPHSFESGYIKINNDFLEKAKPSQQYKTMVSAIAKNSKTTYRAVENVIDDQLSHFIIYFKFIDDNNMAIETYGKDDILVSRISFGFGIESDPEPTLDYGGGSELEGIDNLDNLFTVLNYINMAITITCLWYIATTSKTTKYVYEEKTPVVISRKKNVVKVSDTKTITTPIYDMSKIRIVNVEKLQNRKKGWTYSHSFQVHGHYRHYKSGKVIFVQSFIKGKDKEFKAQTITLAPEDK